MQDGRVRARVDADTRVGLPDRRAVQGTSIGLKCATIVGGMDIDRQAGDWDDDARMDTEESAGFKKRLQNKRGGGRGGRGGRGGGGRGGGRGGGGGGGNKKFKSH